VSLYSIFISTLDIVILIDQICNRIVIVSSNADITDIIDDFDYADVVDAVAVVVVVGVVDVAGLVDVADLVDLVDADDIVVVLDGEKGEPGVEVDG
jgi:hypothetical protein